ncbi:MAG: hypothetical protein QGG64_29860 [Candidatus Latescibacteria bacterium]|nr:hypothetical protein [Candidatus Latescibacterota bacterium]
MEQIPLDDSDTFALFGGGDTEDVWGFESAEMRNFLPVLQPHCIGDLIALRGLFSNRPDLIDGFVAGKQGQQNVAHEVLRPVLEDTYGLLIYQEQLMEVAHRVAGFSYTQADLLRRALGKEEDVWRGRFVGGCESNGLTEEVGVLCYAVLRDSGHLVNRSHWVAYGVLSYWVGYLKVHYAELFDGVVKGLEDNGGL